MKKDHGPTMDYQSNAPLQSLVRQRVSIAVPVTVPVRQTQSKGGFYADC